MACGLFVALSLVLTGPALLSGGRAVCAADAPDTWVHMWAFWRTQYALQGKDAGYFVSHVITYPGVMREPIAIFDPLLPLAAAAMHRCVRGLPAVFNLLVAAGLACTGMAGYLFATVFTRRRAAALVAGVLAAFNPFLYRQIVGGYTEYAWWGLVPCTAWLYVKAVSRGGTVASKAGYVASLLLTFLMSIHCAAVFTVFALLALARDTLRALRAGAFPVRWSFHGPGRADPEPETGDGVSGGARRLRRVLRLQRIAILCLTPLLLFWMHHLSLLRFRGIPWNRDFPREQVAEIEARVGQAEPMGAGDMNLFSTWRTLHGSVDLADLLSLSTSWTEKEERRKSGPDHTLPFLAGAQSANFEALFGVEWLALVALIAAAFHDRRRRGSNAAWLAAAGLFFLLALGPFPVWNGRALTSVSLPYAWLYRWLPGFSRLTIPGRALFGTLLCLSVPAARGADAILDARRGPPPAARSGGPRPSGANRFVGRPLLLACGLFLCFAWLGYGSLFLPRTPALVAPVYHEIARDTGSFALLELPVRGNFDRRMYSQSVHGRPIYRGVPATFMTEIHGMSAVAENLLVRTLEMRSPRLPAEADLNAAIAFLAGQGFRYLLLHRDGYDLPGAWEAARSIVRLGAGEPFFEDNEVTAWRLTR